MGTVEDKVREDIIIKFGSIPKMAKAIGLPATTIYHALDRGLDNTTSKTRKQIVESLYSDFRNDDSGVVDVTSFLSNDELELLGYYRKLPPAGKHAVIVGLRDFAEQKGKG